MEGEGGTCGREMSRVCQVVNSVKAVRAGEKGAMIWWMRRSQSASDSRTRAEVMLSATILLGDKVS